MQEGALGSREGGALPECAQQVWSRTQTGTGISWLPGLEGEGRQLGMWREGQRSGHMSVHLSLGWEGSEHSVTRALGSLREGETSEKNSAKDWWHLPRLTRQVRSWLRPELVALPLWLREPAAAPGVGQCSPCAPPPQLLLSSCPSGSSGEDSVHHLLGRGPLKEGGAVKALMGVHRH